MDSIKMIMLLLLLWLGAISDIEKETIPNELILMGWSAGLFWGFYENGLRGIGSCILAAVVPIVLLMGLFWLKMLGAGDIKLLSVLFVFLGNSTGMKCLVISFILNAIAAFLKMLYHRNLMSRMQYLAEYIFQYLLKKERVPYYEKTQGTDPVIHFSIGILMSLFVWGEFMI